MTPAAVASPDEFERTFGDALAAVPEDHRDPDRFVPGVGPLDADVVLIGEAPGKSEVEQGEPFVGRAGSELDDVLTDLGVDREAVYLTNVVKVRPPENRTPRVGEVEAWAPVLDAELDRLEPAVVVPLGNSATRAILQTDASIGDLHGEPVEHDGRTVVPAYHPAAGFYDRSKRETFAEDLAAAFGVAEEA